MRLVVDTNIIISALLKDSKTRKMILNPYFNLYTPEFAFEEIEKHVALIESKSGLKKEDISLVLKLVMAHIEVVPREDFRHRIKDANDLIGSIDKDDIPFLALALSFPNEGIWTSDKDFAKQKKVKVWGTTELIKLIEGQ